jgi:hypothetical protein
MTAKQKRVRSPAYPAVSLKVALKKASEFYKVEGRNEAYQSVALTHWGYSPNSGNGLQLAAALASYGLVDASGSGSNRKVKLSQIALKILLDDREDSSEKLQYIQSLALKPKINQKLWNLWGADLPSPANMKHHLIFEENFNEKSVASFVKDYIETIEFAGLDGSNDHGTDEASNHDEDQVSEEGSLDQGSNESPQTIQASSEPKKPSLSSVVSDAEVEIAKFPVGRNCTIRVISNRNVGNKEIQALVAQLQLNLELGVFDDEIDSEN